MPCLIVLLAFFAPRVALAVLLIFTHFLEAAYSGWMWPVLGFFFMPLTTIMYALAINYNGSLSGVFLFLWLICALFDLGVMGGGARTRVVRRQFTSGNFSGH